MRYATPELVVIGRASVLVQGADPGKYDNSGSLTSRSDAGILLGLDD